MSEQTALAVPRPLDPGREGIHDMRHLAMSLPVAQQSQMLAEYKERRDAFRSWLMAQLTEGIHYGFPPGCEPKYHTDENGKTWLVTRSRGKDIFTDLKQWTPKPSFYAAGADFVCDLLAVRDVCEADLAAWEQLGKPEFTFVFKCELYSRATGELMGEGIGAQKTSDCEGNVNSAAKKAKKCAKVDAVLDTWGLRDLFTQDLENMRRDPPPPAQPNPGQAGNAPKTEPRAQRKTDKQIYDDLVALQKRWASTGHDSERTKGHWQEFCRKATGGQAFDASKVAEWKLHNRISLVERAICELEGGSPPPAGKEAQSGLPF